MTTRRNFIKYTLALGAGMFLTAQLDPARVFAAPEQAARAGRRSVRRAARRLQIPGGTLDPLIVPKYEDPLVIPPAMPQAKKPKNKGPRNYDYYEIAVRQFEQNILPVGMGLPTTVWSYGAAAAPGTFNYPAFTIEATHGKPVRVKWINGLVGDDGKFLPHLLPVDPTLHWANPPGGDTGRDTRPTFTTTPGPYTGPVPMVTHVHGSVGVGDESDGYAEAWFLPNLSPDVEQDIDLSGYAFEGTWYEFFKGKFLAEKGEEWAPGTATFQYPNTQRASTIWYHDHTLGMTRLNVYAGPAGFFLVRGGADDLPSGWLPGPAPGVGANPFGTFYEIPIAIQDRSFNSDGSLFYPDTREFFDGATAEDPGFIPNTDLSPIWNPEFFGNMMVVNGRTWPYLNVEQRRYRFRFLDGCDARFLILDFSELANAGAEVWMIGNEGGFLAAPVPINTTVPGFTSVGQLLMSPAERADVIVDFTNVPVGNYRLLNIGPDEPYNGGPFDPADPDTTGQVMQFRVGTATSPDNSIPPQNLRLPGIAPLPDPVTTRPLALLEMMSDFWDGPAAAMLGNLESGNPVHKMWAEPISENPNVGDTEIWEYYNFTADAHPMHIHEVLFKLVNRQALVLDTDGEPVLPVATTGDPAGPEPWEDGWKDTVIAYPGQVTRVQAQFNNPGQFVWHCHIVEHEDNEMMRPYRVGPVQEGQPGT